MSYIKKSGKNVLTGVIGVMSIGAIAIWQFYLFVTFKDTKGMVDLQGGTHHLWWAIGVSLIACLAGFFVLSVFLRHDTDDELHITS